MDRFLHLIVNKQSRKSESTFKKLLIELPKHTQNYKIYVTETTDKLDDVVKDLKISIKKSDLVIVIGGDGSLNHALNIKYIIKWYFFVCFGECLISTSWKIMVLMEKI